MPAWIEDLRRRASNGHQLMPPWPSIKGKDLTKLIQAVEQLSDTLDFYAQKETYYAHVDPNHHYRVDSDADSDQGAKARQALAGDAEEGEAE